MSPSLLADTILSPPTRGAWIETKVEYVARFVEYVAPHAGGVD